MAVVCGAVKLFCLALRSVSKMLSMPYVDFSVSDLKYILKCSHQMHGFSLENDQVVFLWIALQCFLRIRTPDELPDYSLKRIQQAAACYQLMAIQTCPLIQV